ncbi:2'-5'-oligoadenylate synthase-like protein isoform c [Daubentonia madagascariensis]|uniref:2'-5'-oligoadenylate synthase-like protein isoform c n=1 Tax=Daubentonia madagascariensis TaxID=31869 RepID=A0ABD2DLW2_DAUMA
MAVMPELFETPASRLNSFVSQWLQPCRAWKEEVQEVVRTVEQFLRQEHFQGERGLDQEVRVLKVVKVGSLGNGTVLRSTKEVELVVFLSCFHSFQEEIKYHRDILRLLWRKVLCCQDLLALGLIDLRVAQGVPDTLVFTIHTKGTMEPITVTIVPAYRVLGPSVPTSQLPALIYVSLIKACGDPGNFSPSFSELQKNFVKYRPTKLKSLLRLVKHWYQQRARDIQVTVEQQGFPDLTLRVNPYESIKMVKEKIQGRRAYSSLQHLSLQAPGRRRQLLRSQSCLADYGIFSNTHIYLLATMPCVIQVFVKKPDGGSHAYAIDPKSFVLGLKQQIEDHQGLPKQQQQLQFQGQVLQDWLGLGYYGIQDSDTLILSKKKAGEGLFPDS